MLAQRQGTDGENCPPDDPEVPGQSSNSPRKRKRSRKGDTEKRYECKQDGCGKSYSRAEHLYRHQLNRTLSLHGRGFFFCVASTGVSRRCILCRLAFFAIVLGLVERIDTNR